MRPFLACLLALPALAADSTQVSITPLSLTFAQQVNVTTSTQAVIVSSPVTGSYTVTRPASTPWLLFSSSGGTSLNRPIPDVLQVGVDGSGLAPGTYGSALTFKTPAGDFQVKVSLLVTAAPVLVASPGLVGFDYSALPPNRSSTSTVGIFNSSGAFVLIAASTTTPWLSVRATGATVQITADPTKVPGDIATGSVSVTSTSQVANNPLVIPVVFLRKGFLSQGPNATRMVNGANWTDASQLAPGEIVTLGGTALGPSSLAGLMLNDDGTVATTSGGVQVLFNGVPGPMVYASANQISAVVPYEIAGSDTASVQVVVNGVGSNALSVPVTATSPAIFTANSSGSGPGAILNQDFTVNSPDNPAARGSTVAIYATGEGQTNPPGKTGAVTPLSVNTPAPVQTVTAEIDGQPATVRFAGEAPGLVSGVLQVNVQIPENARSGELPVTILVGGVPSQKGVTVSVR